MVLRSLLFLILTSLTVYTAESVTCTFGYQTIDVWGYGCDLNNQTIVSENDLARINGEHLTGFGDRHVIWITSIASRISFFPSTLIEHFPNLTLARFHKSQMTSFSRPISCGKLERIDLRDNLLSEIPEGIFDKCSHLKELSLNGNNIGRINEHTFSALTNVESLGLRQCNISSIHPNAFKLLLKLGGIDLSSNQLDNLDSNSFKNLRRLSGISIDDNRLTSLPENLFVSSRMLYIFNVSNNQITRIGPSVLNPCNNEADLSNNLIEQLPVFGNSPNLRGLNLANNKIRKILPGTFKGFWSLYELRLAFNQIEDLQLGTFTGLYNLKKLFLNSNKITELQPNTFVGLTNLYELWLSDNQLTHLIASSFEKMYPLWYLQVERNQIERIDYELFDVLPNLQLLNLTGNVCADRSFELGWGDRISKIFPIIETCGTSLSAKAQISNLFLVSTLFLANYI